MWNPVFEFCATFQEGHYYGLDLNVPPKKKLLRAWSPVGGAIGRWWKVQVVSPCSAHRG